MCQDKKMIIAKYCKKDFSIYTSHIDLLKLFVYNINRAGIKVKSSQGFNPHYLIYFGPPLAVGLESECELVAVDTDEDATAFMQKFNAVAPDGIKILEAKNCSKNPNLAFIITAATFNVTLQSGDITALKPQIEALLNASEIVIQYISKGVLQTKNVKSLIQNFSFKNRALQLTLSVGQNNLRPDRLMDYILTQLKIDDCVQITKVKNYIQQNEQLAEYFL